MGADMCRRNYVVSDDPEVVADVIQALMREYEGIEATVQREGGMCILDYNSAGIAETTIVSLNQGNVLVEGTRPLCKSIVSDISLCFESAVSCADGFIYKLVLHAAKPLNEQAALKREDNTAAR